MITADDFSRADIDKLKLLYYEENKQLMNSVRHFAFGVGDIISKSHTVLYRVFFHSRTYLTGYNSKNKYCIFKNLVNFYFCKFLTC